MGRIRRQRRYKSCDPFSMQKQKQDKYDLPPQRKDESDVHFEETKSYQYFQEKIDKAQSKKNTKTKTQKELANIADENGKNGKKRSSAVALPVPMGKLPNETTKNYFARLDQNVQQAVNSAMAESKSLRKKRKLHLKSRDEKRKTKKKKLANKEDKNFTHFNDNVTFGDVAYQPPISLPMPRKASSIKKPLDLKLMSLIQHERGDGKRRRDMSMTEKKTFDDERQKIINAYRLMKQRKEIKDTS